MKQVVIVGGGYAGLRLARRLSKRRDIVITLINDSIDFRYCPTLYRTATGFKKGISRISIEWILLNISNVDFVVGRVVGIDENRRQVRLQSGQEIMYDYVVFGLGSVTSYFGIEGMHEHAFGVKSLDEIEQLRLHLHKKAIDSNQSSHNYVVIGAGPTGVEVAGSLGQYLNRIYRNHKSNRRKVNILLVEAAPRVLPTLSERAAKAASKRLGELGVEVMTGVIVKKDTLHTLYTANGSIQVDTVIWTAGTANNPFFTQFPNIFTLDKRGRVVVDTHLSVSPRIYVVGDNAAVQYVGLALSAIRHADYVAKDIISRLKSGNSRPKFKPKLPVNVIPIGERWAVLQYGWFVASGRLFGLIRKVADLIGYSDVMGLGKALTIWGNDTRLEDACQICHQRNS